MAGKRRVAVSGGFDPLHVGHLEMFQEARALGDELVVILNNDHWLRAKKGHAFMPEQERAALIAAYPFVDEVVITEHPPDPDDMSVCDALRKVRPHIFANGGDRKSGNTPEVAVCEELGIELAFNAGQRGKIQSSSDLIGAAVAHRKREPAPWGESVELYMTPDVRIRALHLADGGTLVREAGSEPLTVVVVAGIADACVGDETGETRLSAGAAISVPSGSRYALRGFGDAVALEVVHATVS